jgi:hypothetical protein
MEARGGPGWTAVVGDWDGSGHSEPGTVDPNGNWYLIGGNGQALRGKQRWRVLQPGGRCIPINPAASSFPL